MNIDIKIWKYLLIIYFNSEHPNDSYCKELVKNCILNDICYIYYEPIKKMFLDENFMEITHIDFNLKKYNLDFDISLYSINNLCGDINEYFQNKILLKNKKLREENEFDIYNNFKKTFNLLVKQLRIIYSNNLNKDSEVFNTFRNNIVNILNINYLTFKDIILITHF